MKSSRGNDSRRLEGHPSERAKTEDPERVKCTEGTLTSSGSWISASVDGNILRDKQNVLCRGHIRKCTLSSAKEVRVSSCRLEKS